MFFPLSLSFFFPYLPTSKTNFPMSLFAYFISLSTIVCRLFASQRQFNNKKRKYERDKQTNAEKKL